jgi:pimeloyl-ACP methyl ester carboxylesterase
MNPFFFGTSERQLFGVYHPPKARKTRDTGVVLCCPLGQEYMRSHRAFRQLALLLERGGFHVLRFDYAGTGDSWGDGERASLAEWSANAASAVAELRDTAEVKRVALVGLRLGAAVAALAARDRDDVSDVVLWDPVVRGADYAAELLADAELPQGAPAGARERLASYDGTVNVMGYPLTSALRREIAGVDLLTAPLSTRARHHVVVSSERPEYGALVERGQRDGLRLRYHHIPSEGDWNFVDNFGSVLIPQLVIQGIVRLLGEEGRA